MAGNLELTRQVGAVDVAIQYRRIIDKANDLALNLNGDDCIRIACGVRELGTLLDKVVLGCAFDVGESSTANELDARTLGDILHPRAGCRRVVVGHVVGIANADNIGGARQRNGIHATGGAVLDGCAGCCDGRDAGLRGRSLLRANLVDALRQLGHAGGVLIGRLGIIGGILVDECLELFQQIFKVHFCFPSNWWRLPLLHAPLRARSCGARAPRATPQSLR